MAWHGRALEYENRREFSHSRRFSLWGKQFAGLPWVLCVFSGRVLKAVVWEDETH